METSNIARRMNRLKQNGLPAIDSCHCLGKSRPFFLLAENAKDSGVPLSNLPMNQPHSKEKDGESGSINLSSQSQEHNTAQQSLVASQRITGSIGAYFQTHPSGFAFHPKGWQTRTYL